MSEWPDVQLSFDLGGGRYLHPGISVRRALIIGVNHSLHPDPRFWLRECVKDAFVIANFLHGFDYDDIRIMTDDNPRDLPTKDNILGAMRALVDGAQPGDTFFFYFSGHGLQIRDEDDGLDECICAMDYVGDDRNQTPDTPGLIVDDVNCIAYEHTDKVLQCSHSSTLLDLPYVYNLKGVVKPSRRPDYFLVPRQKASYTDVISLSACKDNQRSFETDHGSILRCAFIDCMSAFDNTPTYKQLIRSVSEYSKERGYPAKPQLSSSHEIDTNDRFIM